MAKRETGWATGGKETVNGGAGEGNCNVEDVWQDVRHKIPWGQKREVEWRWSGDGKRVRALHAWRLYEGRRHEARCRSHNRIRSGQNGSMKMRFWWNIREAVHGHWKCVGVKQRSSVRPREPDVQSESRLSVWLDSSRSSCASYLGFATAGFYRLYRTWSFKQLLETNEHRISLRQLGCPAYGVAYTLKLLQNRRKRFFF